MTKTFNWDLCSKQHKPEWASWLEANHAKSVTEAEYMEAYRTNRESDPRPHKARRYATAKLRQAYRNLREDYGFFEPLQ
jgi:hypothetical protein